MMRNKAAERKARHTWTVKVKKAIVVIVCELGAIFVFLSSDTLKSQVAGDVLDGELFVGNILVARDTYIPLHVAGSRLPATLHFPCLTDSHSVIATWLRLFLWLWTGIQRCRRHSWVTSTSNRPRHWHPASGSCVAWTIIA